MAAFHDSGAFEIDPPSQANEGSDPTSKTKG